MSDPIEQRAREEWRRFCETLRDPIETWDAFCVGYRTAWEDANAAEIEGEAWHAEAARLEAERDKALRSLRWIAEWCESHGDVQKEDAPLIGATLEGRFRWACIVIEKMGENARRALEP